MKKILTALFLLLALAPLSPVYAQQAFGQANPKCVGSKDYATEGNPLGASDVPTIQGIECLVANVLAVAVTVIGLLAFVMFLVGGFQYLTSGADAKGTETAKKSITFAVLGVIVALASFMILNVISQLTGVTTILHFNTQVENINP